VQFSFAMLISPPSFVTSGFVLVRNLFDEAVLSEVQDHIYDCLTGRKMSGGDWLVPGAPSIYGDPLLDHQIERLLPLVEEAVEKQLYPTYSYARIYRKGDRLPKHKDRPSCEISVTVTLDYEAQEPWLFWVDHGKGPCAFEIPRASGLVYAGIDTFHWREVFSGEWAMQLFLHYVDRDGPHSHLRFDGRSALGTPKHVQE
jgi:hypothetical protein